MTRKARGGARQAAALALALGLLLAASGCQREQRRVRESPPAVMTNAPPLTQIHPGQESPPPPATGFKGSAMADLGTLYQENAYAVSEGERLFGWFNCSGCHSHGGGNIGPPLMDNKWIYGSEPAAIFETIVEGRPNGMPSFRGKMPDYQVWQLVAYVRSLSGLLRKDVAPSRPDHMSARQPPQSTPKQAPRKTGEPR